MREKILFDEGWLFHRGDIAYDNMPLNKGQTYSSAKTERMKWGPASVGYNDNPDDFGNGTHAYSPERWQWVNLPHDYIIQGEMSEQGNNALGFYERANGWYRKHFKLDAADSGRRITLLFDGVASIATVYLNGCLIKHSFCGYTPFEADITDYVKLGEDNVLAVYTQQDGHEGWWYEGGGIYRHVWLIKTAAVAVDLFGVYANAQKNDDDSFEVNIQATLTSIMTKAVSAQLKSEILNQDGDVVAVAESETSVRAYSRATAEYKAHIDNPVLWDIDNPYQYTLKTTVLLCDDVVDEYTVKFGCRYFYVDANNGFFLNGRQVMINGVCAHQDFGLTGKAVPDNIHRHKIALIKQMGANGYRCSHYPQSEAIMDALDEQGLIVMAETRRFESTDEGIEQLRTHILRDRNRPSIFMWSLGNEESYHLTDMGRRINRRMIAAVRELDSSRLITAAISTSPEQVELCADLDVIGVNYNHWSYDKLHEQYPDKPIFVSECCATGTTRGWYFDDDINRAYLSAYDRDTNEWFTGRERFYNILHERPYLFGAYQWIAFEHRGEAQWPRACSQSGAIDLYLQKKDAFYQNQSFWSTKPMVHLLPHWSFDGLQGTEIRVFAYTNCEEIELCVNGKAYGRQPVKKGEHCQWSVPYQPGEIMATGYIGGRVAAVDKQISADKPTALQLRLENDDIHANGQDIALFTCYCTDKHGNPVPDAAEYVSFSCNSLGRVIGTGSDISDHSPVSSPDRRMRAGAISVAVRVGKTNGTLRLYASCNGLPTAMLETIIK